MTEEYLKVSSYAIPSGKFTWGYLPRTIGSMDGYTPLQLRLMKIRDELCGGNAAELARRIEKDATYVNRLFYPIGKKGGKGMGLEIMAVCNEAFNLPPGYWDGVESGSLLAAAAKPAAWPFSPALHEAVILLDTAALLRLENVMRAHLEMEPLNRPSFAPSAPTPEAPDLDEGWLTRPPLKRGNR